MKSSFAGYNTKFMHDVVPNFKLWNNEKEFLNQYQDCNLKALEWIKVKRDTNGTVKSRCAKILQPMSTNSLFWLGSGIYDDYHYNEFPWMEAVLCLRAQIHENFFCSINVGHAYENIRAINNCSYSQYTRFLI